jgi:hypothetical protein
MESTMSTIEREAVSVVTIADVALLGGVSTLVDSHLIFPKGSQTEVGFSRDGGGWKPCPGGTMIGAFGSFPSPAPGTVRRFRLKAVYYDENAGGQCNLLVRFTLPKGPVIFTLPQVASAQGASNWHYSDWYTPTGDSDQGYGDAEASFRSAAPYNNHAAIYSLVMEAHDFPVP